jgi:riboflavin kinase/FMN adenylyltransferase
MKIVRDCLPDLTYEKPVVLTVGNFDGVHLGHVSLLRRMQEIAAEVDAQTVVVTFSNHPIEFFKPHVTLSKLTTENEKCLLMERQGVDVLILLEFDAQFARQTVEDFFGRVCNHMRLSNVVLGHDAVLGCNRHGNAEEVYRIAGRMGFSVEYVTPFLMNGAPVSSSGIRGLIERGQFSEVEKCLGRAFQ